MRAWNLQKIRFQNESLCFKFFLLEEKEFAVKQFHGEVIFFINPSDGQIDRHWGYSKIGLCDPKICDRKEKIH